MSLRLPGSLKTSFLEKVKGKQCPFPFELEFDVLVQITPIPVDRPLPRVRRAGSAYIAAKSETESARARTLAELRTLRRTVSRLRRGFWLKYWFCTFCRFVFSVSCSPESSVAGSSPAQLTILIFGIYNHLHHHDTSRAGYVAVTF